MNNDFIENFELELEENEIFYRIAGCFWAQQYYILKNKVSKIAKDNDISVRKAIKNFSKEIIPIMKKTHLPYKIISKNKYRYYQFYLGNLYVELNKKTGEIIVTAWHIMQKAFIYTEYKAALAWIQYYYDIDQQPILNLFGYIQDKFELNIGAAKIAKTSISSLTKMILDERKIQYKIKHNPLWSEIYIETPDNQIYRLTIIHKAFNKNPALLLNQLLNPHEEYIKNEIECVKIDSYNFKNIENITISLT